MLLHSFIASGLMGLRFKTYALNLEYRPISMQKTSIKSKITFQEKNSHPNRGRNCFNLKKKATNKNLYHKSAQKYMGWKIRN